MNHFPSPKADTSDGGLLVVAFHRTLSSSIAKWLHHAGLNMGHYLMPPAPSNPHGHYEDMPLVSMHERLLAQQSIDWRYRGEVEFDCMRDVNILESYVKHRNQVHTGIWGAKDPRICLFLPAWQKVLGKNGRYLVILRHWSGSVQSLYRRHSHALAENEGDAQLNASFWKEPEQAARMWLYYHKQILALLQQNSSQCVVITQQSVLEGQSFIQLVNKRFALSLDVSAPSPIQMTLAHDLIDNSIHDRMSHTLIAELDSLWNTLLSFSDLRTNNEEPSWIESNRDDSLFVEKIEGHIHNASVYLKNDSSVHEDQDVHKALTRLFELGSAVSLDIPYWESRIEVEARFVPECWELLARSCMNRGYMKEAQRLLSHVLFCGKVQPYIYLLLGQCRESFFDFDAASHCYHQAIARNPGNSIFHVHLVNQWIACGSYHTAEQHLQEILGQYPDKPALVQALAHLYYQADDIARAIEALESHAMMTDGMIRQLATYLLAKGDISVSQTSSHLEADQIPHILSVLADLPKGDSRNDIVARLALIWSLSGVEF